MTDKPVFKTMVAPHPESIKNLEGWKAPSGAYVLLEVPQLNVKGEGIREWGKGLATVNAESRPQVAHHVDALIAKGGRILHYGNFPQLNDARPKRAEKAHHYSQGKGVNAWDELEAHVKMRMGADIHSREEIAAKDEEINALKAKLAAAEAAEKGKKNTKDKDGLHPQG